MGDQHANNRRSIHSPGTGLRDRSHSILRVDDMLQSQRQERGGRLCTPERFVGSGMREFVIAPAIPLLRVLMCGSYGHGYTLQNHLADFFVGGSAAIAARL